MSLGLNTAPANNRSNDNAANIGVASIFALVIVVCLAVLAVLAIATGHSSLVLAERQAAAVQEVYDAETAAQTFVAEVDQVRIIHGAGAIEGSLFGMCTVASDAVDGRVQASATAEGGVVRAEFACESGRILKVTLTITPSGVRIDAWRMTAAVHEEEPLGPLYQD